MLSKSIFSINKRVANLLISATFALPSLASVAAELQINSSGILTGAKNVAVGSLLYDVSFVDGSVTALFSTGQFTFTTLSAAAEASQSLLDQVFVNDIYGHNFDSTPSKVFGCENIKYCVTVTPFVFYPNTPDIYNQVNASTVTNSSEERGDYVFGWEVSYQDESLYTRDYLLNFALWSVAAVPEPSTYFMMSLGLLGIIGLSHRSQKNS